MGDETFTTKSGKKFTVISKTKKGVTTVTKAGKKLRQEAEARQQQQQQAGRKLTAREIQIRRLQEEAAKPVAIGRNRLGIVTNVSKGLENLLGTRLSSKTAMRITTGKISKASVKRSRSLSETEQRKRFGEVISSQRVLLTGTDSKGRQVTFKASKELAKKLIGQGKAKVLDKKPTQRILDKPPVVLEKIKERKTTLLERTAVKVKGAEERLEKFKKDVFKKAGIEDIGTERFERLRREGNIKKVAGQFFIDATKSALRFPLEIVSLPFVIGGRATLATLAAFDKSGRTVLKDAVKEVPKESLNILKSFDPRNPRNIVNIVFVAGQFKKIGNIKTTRPSVSNVEKNVNKNLKGAKITESSTRVKGKQGGKFVVERNGVVNVKGNKAKFSEKLLLTRKQVRTLLAGKKANKLVANKVSRPSIIKAVNRIRKEKGGTKQLRQLRKRLQTSIKVDQARLQTATGRQAKIIRSRIKKAGIRLDRLERKLFGRPIKKVEVKKEPTTKKEIRQELQRLRVSRKSLKQKNIITLRKGIIKAIKDINILLKRTKALPKTKLKQLKLLKKKLINLRKRLVTKAKISTVLTAQKTLSSINRQIFTLKQLPKSVRARVGKVKRVTRQQAIKQTRIVRIRIRKINVNIKNISRRIKNLPNNLKLSVRRMLLRLRARLREVGKKLERIDAKLESQVERLFNFSERLLKSIPITKTARAAKLQKLNRDIFRLEDNAIKLLVKGNKQRLSARRRLVRERQKSIPRAKRIVEIAKRRAAKRVGKAIRPKGFAGVVAVKGKVASIKGSPSFNQYIKNIKRGIKIQKQRGQTPRNLEQSLKVTGDVLGNTANRIKQFNREIRIQKRIDRAKVNANIKRILERQSPQSKAFLQKPVQQFDSVLKDISNVQSAKQGSGQQTVLIQKTKKDIVKVKKTIDTQKSQVGRQLNREVKVQNQKLQTVLLQKKTVAPQFVKASARVSSLAVAFASLAALSTSLSFLSRRASIVALAQQQEQAQAVVTKQVVVTKPIQITDSIITPILAGLVTTGLITKIFTGGGSGLLTNRFIPGGGGFFFGLPKGRFDPRRFRFLIPISNTRVYVPSLEAKLFNIKASARERKELLRVGRVFGASELRKLVR